MDARQRTAMIRLGIICVAWSLGEALAWQLHVGALGVVVAALLAVAAYFATRDVRPPRSRDATYWRGQRIDRDRWN